MYVTIGGCSHTGGNATCQSPAVCTICGAEYGYANHVSVSNGFASCCGTCEPAVMNNGVWEIHNAGNLYWFAQQVNAGSYALNGRLMADIMVNEGTITAETTGAEFGAAACNGSTVSISGGVTYGGTDNNIQVMILLSWDTEEGTGSQKSLFSDEVVGDVYRSNQGVWDSYSRMFSMVITGTEGIANLMAQVVVVSGTNTQYVSDQSLRIT